MNELRYGINVKPNFRIDEKGVNRILQHGEDGMVIVSANKSGIFYTNPEISLEDEYEEWLTANELEDDDSNRKKFLTRLNLKNDKRLEREIKEHGFTFSKVYGGYHDPDGNTDSYEPSYIIYTQTRTGEKTPFEEIRQFALDACAEFKQDSVYIQAPGAAPEYRDMHDRKTNSTQSKDFKLNRPSEEFFTTVKRKRRGVPQRFTADIKFENFYVNSYDYIDKMRRRQEGEVILG